MPFDIKRSVELTIAKCSFNETKPWKCYAFQLTNHTVLKSGKP